MIRTAAENDADQVLAIYTPFVTDTSVSFEEQVPDVAEMRRRISQALMWLVDDVDGVIRGYGYATPHRVRSAYRFTVELSAYVHPDFQRLGVAKGLYERLLDALSEQGFNTALAGITVPNDASVKFHRALGFADVGVLSAVGFKQERWHDVLWMQRPVRRQD